MCEFEAFLTAKNTTFNCTKLFAIANTILMTELFEPMRYMVRV